MHGSFFKLHINYKVHICSGQFELKKKKQKKTLHLCRHLTSLYTAFKMCKEKREGHDSAGFKSNSLTFFSLAALMSRR